MGFMRLTLFTDYAIRVLLFLANEPERLVTVGEIAKKYDVSQHHLVKVVQDLVKNGYVKSTKGRGGGMRLAVQPQEINIGEIVKKFEPEMQMIDCTDCPLCGNCSLPKLMAEAVIAFLGVLNKYSLKDIMETSPQMARILVGV